MIKIIDNREEFLKKIAKRGDTTTGEYVNTVKKIVYDVKENKDTALFKYINEFESKEINRDNICVDRETLSYYCTQISSEMKRIIETAITRITKYHEAQTRQSWMKTSPNGEILGQLIVPLEIVGVYVPGGKASYPSSVLMNIIPAKVAGVKKVIMATPATNVSACVFAAAYLAGVDEVYLMGGAHAISAMAFGTDIVPKVDKIVGPGNIYVALAKKEVYGVVSIDSIAGPSEILVLADETANPKFVAADLLAQAEHDELASAILVTTSSVLANEVIKNVNELSKQLTRGEIFSKSLRDYSGIIVVKTIDEGVNLVNKLAPEHLEISTKNPFEVMTRIKTAGAIFLGDYTPEALGDYMAGPNHVLPTGGTARFSGPLSVDDFIKKTSILSFSKEAMFELKDDVNEFALVEGLTAHALSSKIRGEE